MDAQHAAVAMTNVRLVFLTTEALQPLLANFRHTWQLAENFGIRPSADQRAYGPVRHVASTRERIYGCYNGVSTERD